MADLEDDGLLATKRHELKEYDNLSCFNLPLFEIRPCSQEVKKTVPFKRTLDHAHSFTTVKCHTTLVLSSHVPLSAMSGETHSVVKLSLLP